MSFKLSCLRPFSMHEEECLTLRDITVYIVYVGDIALK
jgi:hypothetical protein